MRTVLRFEIGYGDREALERCELHWNAVVTKLWRGANSIGCSRLNVGVSLMYFTYSSTADQIKLQESSRCTQCVVVLRYSLALVLDVPCWAYIHACEATVGNRATRTVQVQYGWATVLYRLQRVFASRENWCKIETRENNGN